MVEKAVHQYKWASAQEFGSVNWYMEFKAVASRYSPITRKEHYGSFIRAMLAVFDDSKFAALERSGSTYGHQDSQSKL